VYLSFSFAGAIVGMLDKESNFAPWLFLSSLGSGFMAIRRTGILILLLDRVQYFDEYEAKLKEEWPDFTLQDSASVVADLQRPVAQPSLVVEPLPQDQRQP
jgi:hypothetical protein